MRSDWKLDQGLLGGPVKDRLVQSREPGHRTEPTEEVDGGRIQAKESGV